MCGGKLPDPLGVHKAKSKGGMGLPDPLGLFDSAEAAPPAPTVVAESPKADAAAAATEAAQKAGTEKLAAQRRRRGLSLLASGADGDTSATATAKGVATGKTQLGA